MEDMLEVIEMLIVILGEHDYFVDVHQANTPTNTEEDDIKRALEGLRRVAETKRHTQISISRHTTFESCLISILFGDRHLPVSPKSVKEREDLGPREAIYAFIHRREQINVQDGSHV